MVVSRFSGGFMKSRRLTSVDHQIDHQDNGQSISPYDIQTAGLRPNFCQNFKATSQTVQRVQLFAKFFDFFSMTLTEGVKVKVKQFFCTNIFRDHSQKKFWSTAKNDHLGAV